MKTIERKIVARLSILGLDKMTYNGRRAIAKWLRQHAAEISARGAEQRYNGHFRARWGYKPKRTR